MFDLVLDFFGFFFSPLLFLLLFFSPSPPPPPPLFFLFFFSSSPLLFVLLIRFVYSDSLGTVCGTGLTQQEARCPKNARVAPTAALVSEGEVCIHVTGKVSKHFALRPQQRGGLLGTRTEGNGEKEWRLDRALRTGRPRRPWTAARTTKGIC